MTRQAIAPLFLAAALAGQASRAQPPAPPAGDKELSAHLDDLSQRVEDRSVDVGARERLAMEMAAALDRAAQSAPDADARRAYWKRAVAVLDRFRERNPGHPQRRSFEVQGAVYVWATARSHVLPERAALADDRSRALAVAELKEAIDRLLPAVSSFGNSAELPAQNARYRLAQALADLAAVAPGDPREARARNEEALAALARPITEAGLQGYADLLRAQLLLRLNRLDEAKRAIDAAASAKSPPPAPELLDSNIDVLTGKNRYEDAFKAVEASALGPASKLARRVAVGLRQREGLGVGPDRAAAEASVFKDLKALRDAGGPEAGPTLAAVAAAIPIPGPDQNFDAWDVLADGALAQGNPDRAGDLSLKGAERAEGQGEARQAATLRLKAGAALFQAGRHNDADAPLSTVALDANAGDLRPRAAMLRALNRGRGLAANEPGATAAGYESALAYMIESFPNEPTAPEARWLLGRLKIASGDRDGAFKLWKDVPRGSPRWLDIQVAISGAIQEDLDAIRLTGELDAAGKKLDEARSFLDGQGRQAKGDVEINEIRLARARLELTPGVGKPEVARAQTEAVLRSVSNDAQRDAAGALHVVALAQTSRYVEAEQEAIRGTNANFDSVMEALRILDRSADEADSDLKSRRMGLLMTTLVKPISRTAGDRPPKSRAEAKLREVRGALFGGADDVARRLVTGLDTSALVSSPGLLRDLADTYNRLGAFDLAADVQRLRMKQLPAGSVPWLDARYGLALAYHRGGESEDAAKLIDATSILHPELGGGTIRDKFIRLRQRIGPASGPR